MPRSWRLVVALALAVISVGIAVTTFVRGGKLLSYAQREGDQKRQDAAAFLARATTTPLADSTAAIEAIASNLVLQSQGDGSQQRVEALKAAHSFLLERFMDARSEGEAGVRAYAERQLARGFRMRTPEELSLFRIEEYFLLRAGKPLPDGADMVDTFVTLATLEDQRHQFLSVPTGISVDPATVSVHVGEYTRANPGWPRMPSAMSDALAYTTAIVNNQSYWRHPEDLRSQLDERGSARVAQVQFILDLKPGVRRGCLINLVWAPRAGEWLVDSTGTCAESMNQEEWVQWQY